MEQRDKVVMQMNNQAIQPPHKLGLLATLLLLTGFFILLEISLTIECSGMYFGDIQLVAKHLDIPKIIWPGVYYFLFAQVLVHAAYIALVWCVARLVGIGLSLTRLKTEYFGIFLWCFGLITILLANRYFFPNSKYSTMLLSWVRLNHAKYVFAFCLSINMVMFMLALFGLLKLMKQHVKRSILLLSVLGSVSALAITGQMFFSHHAITDAATRDRPNIIIIGLDSLRPDFVGYFGSDLHTPALDQFLNQATVFSESLTALARTYPSWVSVLTGLYPKISSARTDLMDPAHLNLHDTLPAMLQRDGYETVYAIDDARFSNIDENYGFDRIASDRIGFNDFLLGTLNDFPISNMLVNTFIGKYLFPYSYANRAAVPTYYPNTFIDELRSTLNQPRTKPMFLVVHFCLMHYPYAWAGLPIKSVHLEHFQASIERGDQQFRDFMQVLQQDKLLEHSIVILLSDHGEAAERAGDRITEPGLYIAGKHNLKKIIPHFYPPSAEHEAVNMSGGHGTDVLGLTQYHTVLAFKTYGMQPNQVRAVPGLVSLMDIKPTILAMLKLPVGQVSGYSLLDQIFGNKTRVAPRTDFFTESDFSPEAVRSVHPEERTVLFEGIDYYKIDPKTARVMVRDNMLSMIISSKQYADFYGSWVLGLYPQNKNDMMPVLVNLETGQWTTDLSTPFAEHSPANHMLSAMKNFFKQDLTHLKNA